MEPFLAGGSFSRVGEVSLLRENMLPRFGAGSGSGGGDFLNRGMVSEGRFVTKVGEVELLRHACSQGRPL